jgi:cellulose synthase operon protein YhjQ
MPLIAFTSPKGGVGKSTLAGHVAAILRRRGHKVLALDLDPQNALRLHLGLPIDAEQGFMSRLALADPGPPSWQGDVVTAPSGVDLLPYGAIDPRRATEFAARLAAHPELLAAPVRDMLSQSGLVMVVDTPPGPNAALEAVLPMLDMACLVLLADAGSAALMPMVANGQVFGRGTLAARFAERVAVVINQMQPGQRLSEAVMDCAMRALGDRLLGVVGQDMALAEALAQKRLLLDGNGRAAEDLQILADQIVTRLRLKPQGAASDPEFKAFTDWGLA